MEKDQTNRLDQLETIFDHLPYGVITVSASFRILNINANACAILRIPKPKAIDKKIQSIFKKEFYPLQQIVRETKERKRPIKNFTIEVEGNGHGRLSFLVSTCLIKHGETTDGPILLVLHDISETTRLHKQSFEASRFEALVGETEAMKKVFSMIETVAPTDAAVLIYGETGTGKELVARAIHHRSDRAKGPFVPVHCSAITSSLLESDLFGHTKGAFTGAIKDKPGRFDMADGGTVFLDEIATLSQEIQINLLRVLQEKTIEKVGATKSVNVDVRVISATNRVLPDLIRQGLFRKDLYYRIKVLQLNLPPLRKRKKDILILARYFIERFNRQHGYNVLGITSEAKKIVRAYPWPGNVRELENAIEHAVIIGQYSMIEPRHLPEEIRDPGRDGLAVPHDITPESTEADRIGRALEKTAGNVTRAADLLGIHRTTLWRKMREFSIDRIPEQMQVPKKQ